MKRKLTALAFGITTALSAGQFSANDSMAFGLDELALQAAPDDVAGK